MFPENSDGPRGALTLSYSYTRSHTHKHARAYHLKPQTLLRAAYDPGGRWLNPHPDTL